MILKLLVTWWGAAIPFSVHQSLALHATARHSCLSSLCLGLSFLFCRTGVEFLALPIGGSDHILCQRSPRYLGLGRCVRERSGQVSAALRSLGPWAGLELLEMPPIALPAGEGRGWTFFPTRLLAQLRARRLAQRARPPGEPPSAR